jgi:secreted trypsin-like serine protease
MTQALGMRVFATLVVWAVAALIAASPVAAIKDGQAIKTAPAWAAYVTTVSRFLFTQTSETSCTGAIVADGWVVTAAHCVVSEDAHGHPTSTPLPISKFEVVLGRSDLSKTSQGGQWTVDQLQIDPLWDPARLTGDVALLRLSGPLPSGAAPLPLAPSSFSLPDGALPIAYGYGCTSTAYGQVRVQVLLCRDNLV